MRLYNKLDRMLAIAVVSIAVSGCMHFHHSEFQDGVQADTARRLYDPIAQGEQQLVQTLASMASTVQVYSLSYSGVEGIESAPVEEYWNERRMVLYRVAGDGDESARWIYLSPRTLNVYELGQPLPPDCDLVETGANRYAAYRSVPVVSAKEDLEIHRFEFVWDAVNGITFATPVRITDAPGADYHAVPLQAGQSIAYLHRDGTGPSRLMMADANGANARSLGPEQAFEARYPRVLPDGQLAVAANPDGYFRVYVVNMADDGSAALREAPYPLPGPSQAPTVAYAVSAQDGVLQPTLLSLPSALGLEQITAMVTANNPAINQRRAELAAALIEAGAAKLSSWPVITFGLEYEKNTTVFVDKPQLYPADLFTTGLTRGVLGFVQPILDFRHNYAMSKADAWRAEGLRDSLNNETNDRVAEAAALYFEAVHLKRLIELEQYWIAVATRRYDHYKTLREQGESYRLQIIAAQQVIENLQNESDFHVERYAFLTKKIGHLCGYPESATVTLAAPRYYFEASNIPSESEARDMALLNHPAMHMADHALSEAYYLSETKADIRPSLTASGSMEVSSRDFDRLVTTSTQIGQQTVTSTTTQHDSRDDETSIIGLSGAIPLASLKARQLHAQSGALTIQSLELEKEAMARTIATDVEEACTDFRAAQKDYHAKMASVAYYLEQLRLARVLKEYGVPDTPLEPPLLRETTATEELQLQPTRLTRDVEYDATPLQSQALSDVTAEVEYLGALAELLEVERDLSVRYVYLWREMGLANQVAARTAQWSEDERGGYMTSTWLWHTRRLLQSDEAMDASIATAESLGIRRIYAYLEVDSRLLVDLVLREKFRHFVNACFKHGIEVWGLLGEPEWMDGDDTSDVVRGVDRILAFNGEAGAKEPRIAGVKLDLEPHSLPAWNGDAASRDGVVRRYLGLIGAAHDRAAGAIPVWVDCPPKFFNAENVAVVRALEPITEGMTLMCYFDSENAMTKHAGIALDGYEGPVEIGVEFSDKSAPSERVRDWPRARVDALLPLLREAGKGHANFAGLAYHDFDSVTTYIKENQP